MELRRLLAAPHTALKLSLSLDNNPSWRKVTAGGHSMLACQTAAVIRDQRPGPDPPPAAEMFPSKAAVLAAPLGHRAASWPGYLHS